jgi:hypothetical protein
MASLPDPVGRFERAFELTTSMGVWASILYFAFFYVFGLPSSPVLLPEEVDDICRHYGCNKLEDIAYILHFELKHNDTSTIRGYLSSQDQDLHEQMVLSIDRERMAEKMRQLRIDDFGNAVKSKFEWHRDLTKVDMNQNVFNIASMKNVLTRVADLSKFGSGSAKTVDQFENEVAKGRSKLVLGADGKTMRIVNLAALKIYSNDSASKKMLVQVGEKFEDGRERYHLQLPGTKLGPDDELEDGVKKICEKIGMDQDTATFSCENVEVSERKLESPSYPGLFTVYNKSTINGNVSTKDITALTKVGLPFFQPFTMFNSEHHMTYMFEWIEEQEALDRLSAQEQEDHPPEDTPKPKTKKEDLSYWQQGEEEAEALGELRSVASIMWSLQVREITKKLMSLFLMEDNKGFEKWLLTEKVDNIRNALRDAADWAGFDAANVFKRFNDMISEDSLIAILHKREVLQPVIVELHLGDLERIQKDLRKNSKKPFCKNGHPFWPLTQKQSWTCDDCGENFKDDKEGMHFRCNRCQIDICKRCSEKDAQKGNSRRQTIVDRLLSKKNSP